MDARKNETSRDIEKIVKNAVENVIDSKFDLILRNKMESWLDEVKKQAGINIEELVKRNREIEAQLKKVEQKNQELREYLLTVKKSAVVEDIEYANDEESIKEDDLQKNITDDGYIRFKARINQLKAARKGLRKEIRKTEFETECLKDEISKLKHKQDNLWEDFQQQEKIWEVTLDEINRSRRRWWRNLLGLK
jgi:predicted  nucleic acid-binding Zn-ribbon protein